VVLVGREREQAALRKAIAERRSLLVCGPPDSGKTVLLQDALGSVTGNQRRKCLVCAADGAPGTLWRRIAQALASAGDPEVLARVERETGSHGATEDWIRAQTSLRLRGVLRRAVRGREYSLFLDAAQPLADGTYRLLQEWVWSGRTPVVLLARGATQLEIGRAAQLYCHDGMRLHLGPLEPAAARTLLDSQIERFRLSQMADDEFREFVLERSERLPGSIVRLCEMACNAAYQCEGRLKLHILAVDFLMRTQQPIRRAARHV
jgi:type II secretory pathway predicted ATPase ExeA